MTRGVHGQPRELEEPSETAAARKVPPGEGLGTVAVWAGKPTSRPLGVYETRSDASRSV